MKVARSFDTMGSMTARPPAIPAALEAEEAKSHLRSALRKARQHLSTRKLTAYADALRDNVLEMPSVQAASCVSVYASRSHEPGTLSLIEELHQRNVRVLLPVLGDGLQRGWAEYVSADDLQVRSPGRPPEPSSPFLPSSTLADADVIVVPALAVDTHGTRLGQGGGWYDRALREADPAAPVVALTFTSEVYDASEQPLPREDHDYVVSAVITPDGITRLPT